MTDASHFAANIFGSYNDNRVLGALAENAKAILSDLNYLANSLGKDDSLKSADAYARAAIERVSKEVTPLLYEKGNTGDLWK